MHGSLSWEIKEGIFYREDRNKNTIAVASLTDVSCIILAEGITFSEEDLSCAEKEGITVFSTDLPIFDAALKLQELLP